MPPPLSNTHLRTPFGFDELLTYLTREILRSQPESIYEFCLTTCQQLYCFIFLTLTLFFFFVCIRINERNNGILSHELVKLDSTVQNNRIELIKEKIQA